MEGGACVRVVGTRGDYANLCFVSWFDFYMMREET